MFLGDLKRLKMQYHHIRYLSRDLEHDRAISKALMIDFVIKFIGAWTHIGACVIQLCWCAHVYWSQHPMWDVSDEGALEGSQSPKRSLSRIPNKSIFKDHSRQSESHDMRSSRRLKRPEDSISIHGVVDYLMAYRRDTLEFRSANSGNSAL